MKTSIRSIIMTVIIAGACTSGSAMAHGAQDAGMNVVADANIVYNDTAYAQNMSAPPTRDVGQSPAATRIVYVDKAYGPAIYSYPGRASGEEAIEVRCNQRWAVQ